VTDFARLLSALHAGGVEHIVIGGVALVSHGHVRFTADLDVCYARVPANLIRLSSSLGPLHPRLRGAPPELPFFFDERALRNGLNFTLVTDAGEIDLLGEVTGIGGFEDLVAGAVVHELYGIPVRVIGLADLERAKVAAGRAKDLLDLEAIRALRKLSR
jgi:hypothetical protein